MSGKKRNGEKSYGLVRIKQKSQITIPKKVCEDLGINIGDYLMASIRNKKIVLVSKILVDKKKVVLSKSEEKKMREALDYMEKGKREITKAE